MTSEVQKLGRGRSVVLAVDLGGTKIRVAIVSNKGKMIAKEYHPTLADEGPQAVIERIFAAMDSVLNQVRMNPSQLSSISLAAAGAIDMDKGWVTFSPNLPGWYDIPLKQVIEKKLGVTTFLVNDASAAALGEQQFGAGRGLNHLVYLTVSTGIGGGIIIDGKLYLGASGSAGEIGHMTIDVHGPRCNCGNFGCLETLASGTAMANDAIMRISSGEKSSLTDLVRGKIEDITAETISIAARDGDFLALEVIFRAATYLGVGLANVVNIFNPEMIIIGGGVSQMGDLLLNTARQVVRERAFGLSSEAVHIVTAGLGEDAGLLGAALFAQQQKKG